MVGEQVIEEGTVSSWGGEKKECFKTVGVFMDFLSKIHLHLN